MIYILQFTLVAALFSPALSLSIRHGSWATGNRYLGHGWKHDENDHDENHYFDKHGDYGFTSTYRVVATPDQVVNGTTPTGGLSGAIGYYSFGINSDLNLICFHIVLRGFRGDYVSPAVTATHIHQAVRGLPRIAMSNSGERLGAGCLQGPFATGVTDNITGLDTGAGFVVSQIEDNPANFFCDVHSTLAVPGAVRGQLQ